MADRPRLEAVLFDAGGTLIRLDFEWMAADLGRHGVRVDATTLRRAEVEGRRRYDASVGAARPPGGARGWPVGGGVGDPNAYFGGTLRAAGVPEAEIPAALDRFAARQREPGLWTRPMEGARAALDGVAALGLRAAVVSNSDGRAALYLRDCDMLRGVEFVVDSHEVGIEKPDPRIFAIALERLGTPATRALYVGDIRGVDEVGARAAGLHFVLVDPFGDYARNGTAAIATMERLPEWIRGRFALTRRERPATQPREEDSP